MNAQQTGAARALLDHISGLYLDQLDEAVKRVKQSVRKSRRPGGIFLPGEKVSPLKPASINRRLAILRRVANLAYTEWHWLDRPIAVRLLPEHNQRHRYLSVSEIQALSDACAEPVNQMVIVAAYTGMRRGELLQLTKTNIQGENLFLGMTKNGKPKLLPILPMYRAALFSWIAADKPDPRTMHKHFIKGAKKAGLIGVKPHDLRHTTASLLLNAGHDLATVAEVLNCTLQNAMRYAHLSLDNKRKALLDISTPNPITKSATP